MQIPFEENKECLPFYDKDGNLNIYNAVDKSDNLKLKKSASNNDTSEIRSIEKHENAEGIFRKDTRNNNYQSILDFITK